MIDFSLGEFLSTKTSSLSSPPKVVFFDEALRVCADWNQDYKLAIRIFDLFRKRDSMYLNVFRESNI